MYSVYILYSELLDQYYIGQSIDIKNRIKEHNTGKYNHSFTKRTSDWQLFFSIPCLNRSIAIRIENHIKNMHSRLYIENLKKHPKISEKLIAKYSNEKF